MSIVSINPSNGKKIQEYAAHSMQEVSDKIWATNKAWMEWRNSDHATRSLLLNKMAAVLRERKR